MAEITKNMLEVLELSPKTQERIAQILGYISERSENNTLALAKLIDDHSRAMAQILERIVNTTNRTEPMTAEILARLASTPGESH